MKIILTENLENLGKVGDIVTVKTGYARNYLFPKGYAQLATDKNIKSTQKLIELKEKKDAIARSNLEALAKRLDKITLKFELQAGEDDKLFGSVTSTMIADGIEKEGYKVDKKEIHLEEPIKHVGNHFVEVHLAHELSAKVKIKVSATK
tara:strand:- start:1040 stop:1486 length:447 start_codon:yes stop_codon:yes gene_type:complete